MRTPMSGFFGLLGRLFESGYEKIEDPSYALERAYRQQLQALEETRRGRIEVETIGARLGLELRQLGDGVGACEGLDRATRPCPRPGPGRGPDPDRRRRRHRRVRAAVAANPSPTE
jgi:hypothetical protein